MAERAQFLLGDIHLAQGHYGKARRHLAASLATGTATGETHFLLACAHDWDDDGDTRQAYRHYRRAVELDPGQPLYSSAYALERLRRKTTASKYDREALVRLRDAFAATPDDPDVVYNYVAGLVEMRRLGEAETALRRARKRWPDHPAFESVWRDFLLARGDSPRPIAKRTVPTLRVVSDDEPVILHFPAAAPSPHRHRRRNA
jgi:tetratricopeptide (TPR) repeat protein